MRPPSIEIAVEFDLEIRYNANAMRIFDPTARDTLRPHADSPGTRKLRMMDSPYVYSIIPFLIAITVVFATTSCALIGFAKPNAAAYEDFLRTYYRFELVILESDYDYTKIDEKTKTDIKSFLDRNKKYRMHSIGANMEVIDMLANGDTPPTSDERTRTHKSWLRAIIRITRKDLPLEMEADGIDLDYKAIREEVWKEILAERGEGWREPPEFDSSIGTK